MAINQYLYQLHPTRVEMLTAGPSAEEARVLQDHVAYLEQLTEASVVLMAGRTQAQDEATFGLVILRADSDAEARGIMNNDPAVSEGVMRATLFPYRIAMLSREILASVDD